MSRGNQKVRQLPENSLIIPYEGKFPSYRDRQGLKETLALVEEELGRLGPGNGRLYILFTEKQEWTGIGSDGESDRELIGRMRVRAILRARKPLEDNRFGTDGSLEATTHFTWPQLAQLKQSLGAEKEGKLLESAEGAVRIQRVAAKVIHLSSFEAKRLGLSEEEIGQKGTLVVTPLEGGETDLPHNGVIYDEIYVGGPRARLKEIFDFAEKFVTP